MPVGDRNSGMSNTRQRKLQLSGHTTDFPPFSALVYEGNSVVMVKKINEKILSITDDLR
jgi:hypothetical protein